MFRGTTPTFVIPVKFDISLIESLYITFSQFNKEIFTRELSSCSIKDNYIYFDLTQEETLMFKCSCNVAIQVRGKLTTGKVIASRIKTIPANKILMEGVI